MNLLSYLFEGNSKAAIVCQTELREQDVLLVGQRGAMSHEARTCPLPLGEGWVRA